MTSFARSGTHPHHAHEEAEASQDRLVALGARIQNASVLARPGSIIITTSHRVISPRGFSAPISRPPGKAGCRIVIHARDADADVAAILHDEMGKGAFKGLLHCFTSSAALAEAALSLGLYISFSGVLTFKNSQNLRDIARTVPWIRFLVETDAPLFGAGSLSRQAQ